MHCLHVLGGPFGWAKMAHKWMDLVCFMSWASQASTPCSPCLVLLTQPLNVIGGPLVQLRGIDALFACLGGHLWEGKHGPVVEGLGLFHVMCLPSKHPMLPMLGTPHTAFKCHWRPSGAIEGDRCIVCMLGGHLWDGKHGPLVEGLGLFHVMCLPSKQPMLPMLGLPHTVLTCHWRPSGAMVGVGSIVCMLGGGSLGGQAWPTSGGTWFV
jgi:hypothetical protein